MVNKPKIKGTAAETAIATYLQISGWPYAERRSLQGALDKGDITGTPGICWESKVADAGFQLSGWLRETEIERVNSRSDWGVLVCKPKGLGAARVDMWPAVMRQGQMDRLRQLSYDSCGSWAYDSVIPAPKVADVMPVLKAWPRRAAIYCPPGHRNQPEDWYVAVRLNVMVELLRQAGYGSPL